MRTGGSNGPLQYGGMAADMGARYDAYSDASYDVVTLAIPSITKAVANYGLAWSPFLATVGAVAPVPNPAMYILTDVVLDIFRKTVVNKLFGWDLHLPGLSLDGRNSAPYLDQFGVAAMSKGIAAQTAIVGAYYFWMGDPNTLAYAITSFVSQVLYTVAYVNYPCVKNPVLYTCRNMDGKP
jgi:hypothetical protein